MRSKDPEERKTATPKEVAVSAIPIVVYDACVLYSAFIRDVLLRIGLANIVTCHWTDEIQEEWTRNLLLQRPDLGSTKISEIRSKMEGAFPLAKVQNYQKHVPTLTNNEKDRHVLAAAIEAGASQIVTLNLSHFLAKDLAPYGVQATAPDDFLVSLHADDSDTLVGVLCKHRSGLAQPALSRAEYIERCEASTLKNLARKLSGDERL